MDELIAMTTRGIDTSRSCRHKYDRKPFPSRGYRDEGETEERWREDTKTNGGVAQGLGLQL